MSSSNRVLLSKDESIVQRFLEFLRSHESDLEGSPYEINQLLQDDDFKNWIIKDPSIFNELIKKHDDILNAAPVGTFRNVLSMGLLNLYNSLLYNRDLYQRIHDNWNREDYVGLINKLKKLANKVFNYDRTSLDYVNLFDYTLRERTQFPGLPLSKREREAKQQEKQVVNPAVIAVTATPSTQPVTQVNAGVNVDDSKSKANGQADTQAIMQGLGVKSTGVDLERVYELLKQMNRGIRETRNGVADLLNKDSLVPVKEAPKEEPAAETAPVPASIHRKTFG